MIKSFIHKDNLLVYCIALLLTVLLFLLIVTIQQELSQNTLSASSQTIQTQNKKNTQQPNADTLVKNQSMQRSIQTIATNDQSFSVGPRQASVTVVEFLDFQCPYCKQSVPVIKKLMQEYSRASVKFVFRHFPIVTIHPFALNAALASECARDQGKFFEMHDFFYENQDGFTNATIAQVAQQIHLDLLSFNRCLGEKKYQSRIAKDVTDGFDLSLTGTPLFVINNTPVQGAASYEELKNYIDKELNSTVTK